MSLCARIFEIPLQQSPSRAVQHLFLPCRSTVIQKHVFAAMHAHWFGGTSLPFFLRPRCSAHLALGDFRGIEESAYRACPLFQWGSTGILRRQRHLDTSCTTISAVQSDVALHVKHSHFHPIPPPAHTITITITITHIIIIISSHL